MCESFFATLECELLDRQRFRTHAEAKLAVFDFIEGFYNPHRRHSALDYVSPMEYEGNEDSGPREQEVSTEDPSAQLSTEPG
jgi:putative transposase